MSDLFKGMAYDAYLLYLMARMDTTISREKRFTHLKEAGQKYVRSHGTFFFLFSILFFIRLPLWDNAVWPRHDATYAFHSFYFFYNAFFHGEFAHWAPYGAFGIQSDLYQLDALTAGSYFVGGLGKLFGVRNVLFLFKLSMFFDEFLLLVGIFLLSRAWFRHKTTAFFVSLGVIASTVWLPQIYWNFRVYYLFPLALYLIHRFFSEKKAYFLWLSGITFAVSLLGSPPYFAVLHFILTLPFLAVYTAENRLAWKSIFSPTRINIGSGVLMLAVYAVYLYFASHALNGIVTQVAGRDPVTHTSTVESFLTFGGNKGMTAYLGLIFPGFFETEHTLYIGLLPLLFFAYGLWFVRHRLFLAASASALMLFMLSVADTSFLARASYHFFPLMKYFRYIGHLGGILRLFLLITAGFGLDHFLSATGSSLKNAATERRFLCTAAGLMLAVLFFIDGVNTHAQMYPKTWPEFTHFSWILFSLAALALGLRNTSSAKTMGRLAILFFALDILSYQNLFFATWAHRWPWADKKAASVRALSYQSERTNRAEAGSEMESLTQIVDANLDSKALAHAFIGQDPCLSKYASIWPEGIERLFEARGGHLQFGLPPDTATFLKATGCGTPKVTFASEVIFAKNPEEAEMLVRETPRIDETIVLLGAPAIPGKIRSSDGTSRIIRFGYNKMEIEAQVHQPEGAWLYYADSYHPGWKAYVDGRPANIAEANLAFKAVHIPQGTHRVLMTYFNGLQSISAVALAGIGFLFSLGMCLFSGKRFIFSVRA